MLISWVNPIRSRSLRDIGILSHRGPRRGDKLVFFRRYVTAPEVWNWKTAICIINANGTGFHQITDAKKTNFNQTWDKGWE